MTWRATDPMGNEAGKIKWELVQWTRGRGLDIGCGPRKTFPHWIGVDNLRDCELFGQQMEPDIFADARDLSLFTNKSMDFVFSSHLLEHLPPEEVTVALKEWWRVMKDGGYLVLYLPDEDEYPKMGHPEANPDHKWNVNKDKVLEHMECLKGWDLVDFQKRNADREYSLLFVFKKIKEGHYFSHAKPKPKHEKTAAVVRYGAYGDILQTSSVMAGLKKQGYHTTLFCSPPGSDLVKFDPNIDEFYFQDKDQVPNHLLQEYWNWHKPRFDKWINLCESVEGTYLSLPGRSVHDWAPAARHAHMNRNYLEAMHAIAGVPHVPAVRFFPTADEREWARKERAKMGENVLLWSLAGSAVHKTWPYLDAAVSRLLLEHPSWDVVFVGGEACKILEAGWDDEKRIHKRSGLWDIRQTMTFLEYVECAVGPETGVMNGVSQLEIPKVVFLSHSTVENLTRDWTNCISLWSRGTECPGRGKDEVPACHQLHYNWDYCKKTDIGVAQCQADIGIEQAWHAINHAINFAMDKEQAA